jgi:hypothetical protein
MVRTPGRVLALAVALCSLLIGLAPAAAADTVSGPRLASILTEQWWPATQEKILAGTPLADLDLTRARCPRKVSTEQGTRFTCTAVIDGQRARFDGRIGASDKVFFATGSLMLLTDKVQALVEQSYQAQRGAAGTATCSSRTLIVTAPGPKGAVQCKVTDASGVTSTATLTLDKNADPTDISFSP